MTRGSPPTRSRARALSGWVLAVGLLGAGTLVALLLLEDGPQQVGQRPAPIGDVDPRAGQDRGSAALPPAPVETPSSGPAAARREGASAGAKVHRIEGVTLDHETGRPVPLYEVYLYPDGTAAPGVPGPPLRPHHVRDLEGRFRLTVPEAGSYRLSIRSETHEDSDRVVTVPLEGPLEVQLVRGSWLTGILRSSRGEPQPHVTVWLQARDEDPGAGAPREARTKSDRQGRFAFYKLRPGVHRLIVGPLNAPLEVRDDLLVPDRGRAMVDLLLPDLTEVRLQVRQADGLPIEGARVTLSNEEGGIVRTALTDAEGLVRIPNVQEGPHGLQIRAPGFAVHDEELFVHTTEPQLELLRRLSR